VSALDRRESESPLGTLHLAVSGGRLVALAFDAAEREAHLARCHPGLAPGRDPAAADVLARLRAYFAGDLRALDSIPVLVRGTSFRLAVWRALRAIPPGTTESYAHLAARAARPRGVRATGQAVGANPVALVLPCHRVVGRDGTLTGYGGGLWRKAWLLRHEGVLAEDGSRVLCVDAALLEALDGELTRGEPCPRRGRVRTGGKPQGEAQIARGLIE